MSEGTQRGSLLVIGGHEDRVYGKDVLERFVALAGGAGQPIVILTAASRVAESVWEQYDEAFGALGVSDRHHLHVDSRADANAPALADTIARAGGIFVTGGDQKRLLALTGGTGLDKAMHAALRNGACIAGTSAGASAMSAHMLAYGKAELLPEKGAVGLGAGYGFLHGVVIDQHFSERNRLARLLSIVAQNPHLIGIGIDEDTALQVEAGGALEVLGSGAVTIIDGRAVISNVSDIANHAVPELIGVQLHLLPTGSRYGIGSGEPQAPPALADFIRTLTNIA